jgi:hypothetical protein
MYKNGGSINSQFLRSSVANEYIGTQCIEIVSLSATDYVDLRVHHNQGVTVSYLSNNSFLMVAKIA